MSKLFKKFVFLLIFQIAKWQELNNINPISRTEQCGKGPLQARGITKMFNTGIHIEKDCGNSGTYLSYWGHDYRT